MAVRRICVSEVQNVTGTSSVSVSCNNPAFTPVGSGDDCNVGIFNLNVDLGATPPTLAFSYDAQIKYQYLQHGITFEDYCNILGGSFTFTLPEGLTSCCGLLPSTSVVATCSSGSITTTATSVTADFAFSYTVDNLCVPTILCIDDTTCA